MNDYSLPVRPRRNRKTEPIRQMVQETRVTAHNLIYPLFITEGDNVREEVKSMPGQYRLSVNNLLKEIESCLKIGLYTFDIFPQIAEHLKDNLASECINKNGLYLRAIREVKKEFPEACVMTDVAMDPYSCDGHDGYVHEGEILNDRTLQILCNMAVAQAEAGADIIGPSDMMDGRVGAIRAALDDAGFETVSIMSYTAKYASAFYSPFRDALGSAPKSGDKKTYQMNPANIKEAMIEAHLDAQEGADFLMVKPGMMYLDVVKSLADNFDLPIAVYNISGEYAMVKAAALNGWLDESRVVPELLLSFKRAGASAILTYHAKDAILNKWI